MIFEPHSYQLLNYLYLLKCIYMYIYVVGSLDLLLRTVSLPIPAWISRCL
jgi:hypothetical protein